VALPAVSAAAAPGPSWSLASFAPDRGKNRHHHHHRRRRRRRGSDEKRKENEKRKKKKKLNSCSKMSIVALVVLFFACVSAQSSIDYDTLTAGFQLLPSAVAGQPSLIVPVRP